MTSTSKIVPLEKRSTRPKIRAAFVFGLLTLAWIASSEFRIVQSGRQKAVSPPRLVVDLGSAETSEMRLLPNVGEKTSRRWTEFRQTDAYERPTSLKDLEALPQVGEKRAAELAPYVLPSK